jgi:broad specificity phosphatase PhoE
VSSPLERAVESAEIIANELGLHRSITRDHRLIEAHSRFDGLRYRADLLGHIQRMLEGGTDESAESIALRMLDALREYGRREDRGSIVLGSHQLPIQYLRCKLERGGRRVRPWTPRPPCATGSITTLAIYETSIELLEYWCV